MLAKNINLLDTEGIIVITISTMTTGGIGASTRVPSFGLTTAGPTARITTKIRIILCGGIIHLSPGIPSTIDSPIRIPWIRWAGAAIEIRLAINRSVIRTSLGPCTLRTPVEQLRCSNKVWSTFRLWKRIGSCRRFSREDSTNIIIRTNHQRGTHLLVAMPLLSIQCSFMF